MGCDIHLYAERKRNGKWETLDTWRDNPDYDANNPQGERPREIPSGWREEKDLRFYTDGRNYNLFAALAGARSYHFANDPPRVSDPKGMPEDSCPEIKEEREGWGDDGHTDSWLTLRELKAFDWSTYGTTCDDFRNEVVPKMEAVVKEENIGEDDVRIVFWFDN